MRRMRSDSSDLSMSDDPVMYVIMNNFSLVFWVEL